MKFGFINSMPLSRQWLLGTLLSSLPLLAAIGYAIWSIEQHNKTQQALVDTAIKVNRQLVELQEGTKELERSSRQFAVLQDERHANLFKEKLINLEDLSQLFQVTLDSDQLQPPLKELLGILRGDLLIEREKEPQADAFRRLNREFAKVEEIEARIVKISQEVVNGQLQEQKERFEESQLLLVALGFLALPSSLIFQLLWAYLISKPMNQLSQTIGRLGQGDLDHQVQLDGPKELKVLAERLEWLRSNLKSIEAQKNRLLRHVTHELKTPLAAIFEASSLLEEQIAGPLNGDQLEVITILSENAQRLQEMITQLLNFNNARLTEQNLLQQVDIRKLTKNVLNQYQSLVESRKVRVLMPSAAIEVVTDATLLEMVLSNLLSNALHFSPKEAEVVIRWQQEPEQWWLELSDQGPGIPEQDKDKIFKPFFQGSNKRTGSTKGTGLGLAIVHECVDQLHGDISFSANRPHGTLMRAIFTNNRQEESLQESALSS